MRNVERMVEELGQWPSRTMFMREAVAQRIERYERRRRVEAGLKRPLEKGKGKSRYMVMKFPVGLIEEVEEAMDMIGYWPNITDFVREAVIQKLEEHKK